MPYREHHEALCPKCEKDLKTAQVDEIPYAYCPDCKGIWLSASALQVILTRRSSLDAARVVPHLDMGFLHSTKRRCVGCKKTLLRRHIMDVEIDYCPDCKGIFLDAGELDEITFAGISIGSAERFPSDSDRLVQNLGKAVTRRHHSLFDLLDVLWE